MCQNSVKVVEPMPVPLPMAMAKNSHNLKNFSFDLQIELRKQGKFDPTELGGKAVPDSHNNWLSQEHPTLLYQVSNF